VVDIGDGRYVVLAHLKQGSVTVQVGDVVRRGEPLAAIGNSGHTSEPHLQMQVQDSPAGTDADRTFPWCSATSTPSGPVPGRRATAANSEPVTSSGLFGQ